MRGVTPRIIKHGPFRLERIRANDDGTDHYYLYLTQSNFGTADIPANTTDADIVRNSLHVFDMARRSVTKKLTRRLSERVVHFTEQSGFTGKPDIHLLTVGDCLKEAPKLKAGSLYSVAILNPNHDEEVDCDIMYMEYGVTADTHIFAKPLPRYAWLSVVLDMAMFAPNEHDWEKPSIENLEVIFGEASIAQIAFSDYAAAAGVDTLSGVEEMHESMTHKGWLAASKSLGIGLVLNVGSNSFNYSAEHKENDKD